MKKQHLSWEEFKALFDDCETSPEELLREYQSFLSTFAQLDRATVPELSSSQKATIFNRSWQAQPHESPWVYKLFYLFRQPALTFTLGIVLGCFLMSVARNDPINLTGTAKADELLRVEHTQNSRTYKGTIIDEFYSDFENPTLVIKKPKENEPPQRTLHGTLDNGEIVVLWNL
ncbi:hypothetical protein ACFL6U_13610 [Planctomycetota bacterium]